MWTILSTIGAAAKRNIWTEVGENVIYPNLFVFLVAPPGVGKTQAIKPAIEVLGKSEAVKLLPADASKASLLDSLSQCKGGGRYRDENDQLQVIDWAYGALIVTELSQFMSKYDGTIAGLLTDLFDCLPIYMEEKRSGQGVGTLHNPGLSVLIATATGHLGTVISPELWDSGFMARVVLVYSADKVRPVNMWAKGSDKSELKKELIKDFSQFKEKICGPMKWSEQAKNLIWDWRVNAEEEIPIHNKLTHYMTRRWFHLAKLCMVSALSDIRMEVEEYDFWRAVAWLLEAEEVMPEIFKDLVSHADGEVFEDLKAQMFQQYLKAGRKPIPVAWLYDFLKNRTSVANIERMIKTAEAADVIRRVAGTQGEDALYVPGDPTKRSWT